MEKVHFLVFEDMMEHVEAPYCQIRSFCMFSVVYLLSLHGLNINFQKVGRGVVLLLLIPVSMLGVFYSQLLVRQNTMLNVIYSREKEASTDSIRQGNWMKILFANCIINVQESNDLQMIEM